MTDGGDVRIADMLTYLPFILVGLAVFAAACIAYIAWDLTSEKPKSDSEMQQESED
ncbi:MAG: hypothetical protein ACR2QS_16830 [Woeseiaceae bacterium]